MNYLINKDLFFSKTWLNKTMWFFKKVLAQRIAFKHFPYSIYLRHGSKMLKFPSVPRQEN
jgi:hypothetical protein